LDTTLYRTLQSDIGRKSFIEPGLSHFGMRHIFFSIHYSIILYYYLCDSYIF
jgi:hypothetical protein